MEVGGQIIARLVDSSGKRDSIEGSPGVSSSQREGGQVARANLRQDNGISCLGGLGMSHGFKRGREVSLATRR